MLSKLMKYEFIAVGRIMVPIYIAWVAISLLFGTSFAIDEENFGLINIIGIILFVAVICVAGVMTLVLIIQRFSQGLLGNEGYLMMSVPATPAQHIINKSLTSGIWALFTGLVSIVSIIAVGIPFFIRHLNEIQLIEGFQQLMEMISSIGVLKAGLVGIEIMIMIVVLTMGFALEIYAAISIGHQANNHQTMLSIVAYIGFGIIETIIVRIITLILGVADWMNWDFFVDLPISGFAGFQLELLVLLIIAVIQGAVYFTITWYFTKNRLNLQ